MHIQMSIFDVIPETNSNVIKKYNSLFVDKASDARKKYKVTFVGGDEFTLITLNKKKVVSKSKTDLDGVMRVTGIAKIDLMKLSDSFYKKKKEKLAQDVEVREWPSWFDRLVAWGAPRWLCEKVILLNENGGQAAYYNTTKDSEPECFTYLRYLGHLCNGVVTGNKLYGLEVALPLLTSKEVSVLKLEQKSTGYEVS
ncbi:hypothetical protein [uncultured Shewanella sp.]|uniref:hypothetical protein n=1 Tax=uncultured Shewanella sp. TaxID=173975 RepID=UPI0026330B5B|nr:hypothetical protein [uncultured Shewanella sp.]